MQVSGGSKQEQSKTRSVQNEIGAKRNRYKTRSVQNEHGARVKLHPFLTLRDKYGTLGEGGRWAIVQEEGGGARGGRRCKRWAVWKAGKPHHRRGASRTSD